MMNTRRHRGGLRVSFDTAEGKGFVEFDDRGQVVAHSCEVKPEPHHNPHAAACPHRGAETREVECASCAGNVSLKVFQCGLGGECHMSKKEVDGVTACLKCEPDKRAEMSQRGQINR